MSDFPNGLTVTGTLSVAGSEVPTLTSTSTLTNKTLTAPVLANPSYSGATANGGTVTTIDINGGTIDGTVIGGSSAAAGSFTTLSATGRMTSTDGVFTLGNAYFNVSGTTRGQILTDATNLDLDAKNATHVRLQVATTTVADVTSVGLAVTGAVSATTTATAASFIPSGATVPTNGMYLPSANTLAWSTNSAIKATLDASGNLGLGVTPSAWYGTKIFETVNGCGLSSWTGYSTYGLVQNNYHDGASWKYKTTNFASRFCANDGNVGGFQWYTAPSGTAGNAISFTQAMTLDASGGLIIGHTSGGTADTNSFASDRAGYIVQNHVTGTATATPFAYFAYAGGSIGTITQSGTTAVLYNTTSDARLKENITDASDAASLIDALQVRQFDWKSDGSHQRYGFVAQELYEVAPEAVSKPQDPDEMMAVDYSKLVPMLVKEIQSLRARVAQLEGI